MAEKTVLLKLGEFHQERASSAKITGRTLRFRGRVDLELAKAFYSLSEDDRSRVKFLNFTESVRLFPIGMMPIAADFLSRNQETNIRCDGNPSIKTILERYDYLQFMTDGAARASNYAHRVQQFRLEEQSFDYSRQVYHDVVGRMRCARDVVQAFTWSLDELIGNVFHHAESNIGVLAQTLLFPRSGHLEFTLVDRGSGILRNMQQKYTDLRTDREAIELAIQKGVTSKRENQGWGLFGSTQIAAAAGGTMTIWSGDSAMRIVNGDLPHYVAMPNFPGTLVQCLLRSDTPLSLKDVLQTQNEPISYEVWSYQDDAGFGRLRLQLESTSFGSRKIGLRLRNKLFNAITNSPKHICVVDFANIGLVSNSFADEFLGKAAAIIGPEQFRRNVRLQNLSDRTGAIVNMAINERLRTGI